MTLQTLYDAAMLRGPRSVPFLGDWAAGRSRRSRIASHFALSAPTRSSTSFVRPTGKVVALRCWLQDEIPAELIERYRALGHPSTLRRLHGVERSPVIGSIGLHADGVMIEAEDLRSSTRPVVVLDWLMGPTVLAAVDRACRSRDYRLPGRPGAGLARRCFGGRPDRVRARRPDRGQRDRPAEGGHRLVDYDTAYWPDAPSVPQLDPAALSPPARHDQSPGTCGRVRGAGDLCLRCGSWRSGQSFGRITVRPRHARSRAGVPAARSRSSRWIAALRQAAGRQRHPRFRGWSAFCGRSCLAHPDEIPDIRGIIDAGGQCSGCTRRSSDSWPAQWSRLVASLQYGHRHRETPGRGTDRLRPKPIDPDVEGLLAGTAAQLATGTTQRMADAVEMRDLDRRKHSGPRYGANRAPAHSCLRSTRSVRALGPTTRRRPTRSGQSTSKRKAADQHDALPTRWITMTGLHSSISRCQAISTKSKSLSEASTRRIVGSLAIGHLERALESDDDMLIMEAYDARVLGEQGFLTSVQQNRVDLAFDRHAWLKDVRVAIRKRDLAAIDRLYAAMPDGAHQRSLGAGARADRATACAGVGAEITAGGDQGRAGC